MTYWTTRKNLEKLLLEMPYIKYCLYVYLSKFLCNSLLSTFTLSTYYTPGPALDSVDTTLSGQNPCFVALTV